MPDDVPTHQMDDKITVVVITSEFREEIKIRYANSPDEGRRY
jgi:hypothetical protein